MPFNFELKSASLLFFFAHGLLFSVLLWNNAVKSDNKPSGWLAAFIFLCSLYIAPFMFGYAGWYSIKTYREILFFVPFQQLFLLPPVLYFYVKSSLNSSFQFQRKDWLHFMPAILYAVYSLVVWIGDKFVFEEFYFYADGRDKDLALWYQIAGFLMMVFYLFKCLQLYATYKTKTYETVSYADAIIQAWIQRFLIAFLALLSIRVLFFILNPEWANFGSKYWYYLVFSMLFYYIAFSGYVHAIQMRLQFRSKLKNIASAELLAEATETTENTENDSTKISPEDEQLKLQLERLMTEEKLFTDPSLTLYDVATKLETHPKKVSNIINKGFQVNFNDFVNSYRTQEVIQKVQADENNLKTLLGIALDSGFNSKSTFNRAFKKHTQQTPKEYFSQKTQK